MLNHARGTLQLSPEAPHFGMDLKEIKGNFHVTALGFSLRCIKRALFLNAHLEVADSSGGISNFNAKKYSNRTCKGKNI